MSESIITIEIEVHKAGSLKNLLTSITDSMKSLTLTGPINGTDFKAIRDLKSLEYLDLSNCKFVGGGRTYTINDYGEKISCKASPDELSDYLLVHMEGCKQYKGVILPEGINRIGRSALGGHNEMKSIKIPDSVVEIDDSAFACCCGLTQIYLGKNLKRIGDGAFWIMNDITVIEIPSSVEFIGKTSLFTRKLEKIKVLNPTPPIMQMEYFEFPGVKQLGAFKDVKIIRSVMNPFNTRTCKLIVPKGSLTRYKMAFGWRDFKNISVELKD